MKKTDIFFVVFSLAALFFLNSTQYAFSLDVVTRAGDTEEYIVEKRDTLWDISDAKLEDPFLWPRLWTVNPHIENPDLIYPGTKILIPSREELMRIPPAPAKRKYKKPKKVKTADLIQVPEKQILKYLVSRNLFIASGCIVDDFKSVGEVAFSPMDMKISGKGNTVYLKVDDAVSDKKRFFTIRDIKTVRHPVTNNILGHQIRVTGIVEVTGIENDMQKADVITSFEDIDRGDGLLPYVERDLPLATDSPREPAFSGYIVSSHMDNSISGKGDIIFLDKGEEDGLKVGDLFSVYSELLPERAIATFRVVFLKPSTSSAVITSSKQEISVGARWGNK